MSRSHKLDLREVEVSPDGRYVRFEEKLGSGAYKDVYLSYDTETGKEVAWNAVNLSRIPVGEKKRIRMETEILASLHHPHIINFYHVWENPNTDQICFTTEIVTSGTLKEYTSRVKNIKLKVIKKWCRQILSALDYLHSHSPPIIHRDLKCDNIFINGSTGEVRIGDFGLSVARHTTHVESVLGTPEFMAPELYDENYSEAVDVYAFGMTVLEMTTKEYPFEECFSEDTAILTSEGFLSLDQILKSTCQGQHLNRLLFASHNPLTEQLVYHPATHLIVRPRGLHRMIEFTSADDADEEEEKVEERKPVRRGSGLSLLVTEDHDMYVQRGRVKSSRDHPPSPLAKYKASSLLRSDDDFDAHRFLISSCGGVQPRTPSASQAFAARLGLRTPAAIAAFLSLYGFWVGDGSIQFHTGKAHAILLRRKKEDRAWLHSAVTACGFVLDVDYTVGYHQQMLINNPAWVAFFDDEFPPHHSQSDHLRPSEERSVTDELIVSEAELRALQLEAEYPLEQCPEEEMEPQDGERSYQFAARSNEILRIHSPKCLADWALEVLTMEETIWVLEGYRRADGQGKERRLPQTNEKHVGASSIALRDQLMVAYLHAGCSPHYRLAIPQGSTRGCQSKLELERWGQMTSAQREKTPQLSPKVYSPEFAAQLPQELRSQYRFLIAASDRWDISFRDQRQLRLIPGIGQESCEAIGYEGRVWCVTVPPHGLVIAQRRVVDGRGLVTEVSRPLVVGNCNNAAQIWKRVSAGQKPDVLSRIQDRQIRSFVELCLERQELRLSARELLLHPFLRFKRSDPGRDNLIVLVDSKVDGKKDKEKEREKEREKEKAERRERNERELQKEREREQGTSHHQSSTPSQSPSASSVAYSRPSSIHRVPSTGSNLPSQNVNTPSSSPPATMTHAQLTHSASHPNLSAQKVGQGQQQQMTSGQMGREQQQMSKTAHLEVTEAPLPFTSLPPPLPPPTIERPPLPVSSFLRPLSSLPLPTPPLRQPPLPLTILPISLSFLLSQLTLSPLIITSLTLSFIYILRIESGSKSNLSSISVTTPPPPSLLRCVRH